MNPKKKRIFKINIKDYIAKQDFKMIQSLILWMLET